MFLEYINAINKEVLIIILLFILVLCLLYIRELKRELTNEIYRRLHPQIFIELVLDAENDNYGFHIKNESFSLVKGIKIEDTSLAITDSGFKQELTLRFDQIDFIKPKEIFKAECKVFDKQNTLLPNVAERIIPHLLNASFSLKARYTTAEGRAFLASFIKKRGKFYSEKIELLNESSNSA